MNTKVQDQLTAAVIDMLNNGIAPWRKPWVGTGKPTNLTSKRSYHGINTWTLNATALMHGYDTNYWMTYKQAAAAGAQVRKGEKGTQVVYFSFFEKPDAKDPNTTKRIPLLRFSYAFNVAQIDGELKLPTITKPAGANPDAMAQAIIDNMPSRPGLQDHDLDRAFYAPLLDYVNVPPMDRFVGTPEYYSTMFHELGHSTGHPSRLHRFETDSTDTKTEYSKEELVAEMTASMLLSECNLWTDDMMKNSASYLANWTQALASDASMLIKAGSAAQKAFDFITNAKPETEAE